MSDPVPGTGPRSAKLSIVIPTRNSGSRINATLNALELAVARLEVGTVEIIVIDNDSDEDIQTPIQTAWTRFGEGVLRRIICEPRLGAAYARLKGFREA